MFFQVLVDCRHCHSEFRVTLGVEPVALHPRCPSCGHSLFSWYRLRASCKFSRIHACQASTNRVQDESVIDRVAELNSATGVPSPFVIEAYFGTADPQGHELAVHQRLREHQSRVVRSSKSHYRDAITAVEEGDRIGALVLAERRGEFCDHQPRRTIAGRPGFGRSNRNTQYAREDSCPLWCYRPLRSCSLA